MKKVVFINLIFLLFFPFALHSQTYLGLKTGLLTTPYISFIATKYSRCELNYRSSFAFSGTFRDQVTRHFSIGANASYNFYRADYKAFWYSGPQGEGGSKEVFYQFGYLGFSFYPQLNFGQKLSFYCNAGPYYGILINAFALGEDSKKGLKQKSMLAFVSAVGLQYSVNDQWQIILDVCGKKITGLIDSGNIKNQIELSISLGFFYKVSNNSMLNNK